MNYLFHLCLRAGVRLTTNGETIFASPRDRLTKPIAYGIKIHKHLILRDVPRVRLCGQDFFVVEAEGTPGAFVLGAPTPREWLEHYDVVADANATDEEMVRLLEALEGRKDDDEGE